MTWELQDKRERQSTAARHFSALSPTSFLNNQEKIAAQDSIEEERE